MRSLRIATRASELALCQARQVCEMLRRVPTSAGRPAGTRDLQLLEMNTTGDRLSAAGASRAQLRAEGGKALFVKELQRALLDGEADLAVHSLKDLPATLPEGLEILAVPARAEVRDVLLAPAADALSALPPGARVGTSSLRRRCQLGAAFPRLRCVAMRGNLETRLQKLDRGECEALVLAAAGLQRLDCTGRIREYLPLAQFLPAAGQGALAVEARSDTPWRAWLLAIDDAGSTACTRAERALCRALDADCDTPLGALAQPADGGELQLRAMLGGGAGRPPLCAAARGRYGTEEALGLAVAERLLAQGAEQMLAELRAGAAGHA